MTEQNPENDTVDTPAVDPDEAMPVDDTSPVLEETDSLDTSASPVESPESEPTEPTVPGDGSDSVEGSVETPGEAEPEEKPENIPPGAATPTVQIVAPEDDPDAAPFAAATGDTSDEGTTGDAEAPPEEAVFGGGTGHREHEVDESVTDSTPVPVAGDGGLSEWNELKNMVAEIHSVVTDLSELVEGARPAIMRVTEEVKEKGLIGLISMVMSNR